MYFFNNFGNNQIEDVGCDYLRKTSWNNLHTINLCIYFNYLDNNNIGPKGSKYLTKADWKNLKELFLCTHSIIKLITKLKVLDAIISQKQSGKNLQH